MLSDRLLLRVLKPSTTAIVLRWQCHTSQATTLQLSSGIDSTNHVLQNFAPAAQPAPSVYLYSQAQVHAGSPAWPWH